MAKAAHLLVYLCRPVCASGASPHDERRSRGSMGRRSSCWVRLTTTTGPYRPARPRAAPGTAAAKKSRCDARWTPPELRNISRPRVMDTVSSAARQTHGRRADPLLQTSSRTTGTQPHRSCNSDAAGSTRWASLHCTKTVVIVCEGVVHFSRCFH